MPELPEVETISNTLRPLLAGKMIRGVRVLWPRSVAQPSADEFVARLRGQRILETGRRGKFLVMRLSGDFLLCHLRMSGDLVMRPAGAAAASHDRVVLELEGEALLAFNDARKFGRLWLVSDPLSVYGGLGPEPLDDAFTPQVFYDLLRGRHRQLKPLLLDQKWVAGVGNIYSDEALHLAKLHPLTPAHRLSFEQAEVLWRSLRAVLAEGIQRHGASIDWVYRGGDFQNYFRVYQRAGQPCLSCGVLIERIVVGQRGAHFCPHCQPVPHSHG